MEDYPIELAVQRQPKACDRSKTAHYDLVLLDLMMPDRSGIEVLADIRQRDTETPIIMITAYGSVEVAVKALKAGANDYSPSPGTTKSCWLRSSNMIARAGWSGKTPSSSGPSSSATVSPTSSAKATECSACSTRCAGCPQPRHHPDHRRNRNR